MPSATGKLRRGELGRGRNGLPATRENQSPLEWSWHWRHRNQQTVDQWAPLGGGCRRGPGQDIAPRKVCHALSKPPPKNCRRFCYLFRCLSLNVAPRFCWMLVPHAQDGALELLKKTEISWLWMFQSYTPEDFILTQPLIQVRYFFPVYKNIFWDFPPLQRLTSNLLVQSLYPKHSCLPLFTCVCCFLLSCLLLRHQEFTLTQRRNKWTDYLSPSHLYNVLLVIAVFQATVIIRHL